MHRLILIGIAEGIGYVLFQLSWIEEVDGAAHRVWFDGGRREDIQHLLEIQFTMRRTGRGRPTDSLYEKNTMALGI